MMHPFFSFSVLQFFGFCLNCCYCAKTNLARTKHAPEYNNNNFTLAKPLRINNKRKTKDNNWNKRTNGRTDVWQRPKQANEHVCHQLWFSQLTWRRVLSLSTFKVMQRVTSCSINGYSEGGKDKRTDGKTLGWTDMLPDEWMDGSTTHMWHYCIINTFWLLLCSSVAGANGVDDVVCSSGALFLGYCIAQFRRNKNKQLIHPSKQQPTIHPSIYTTHLSEASCPSHHSYPSTHKPLSYPSLIGIYFWTGLVGLT